MVTRLGMVGFNEGNGHPYSFSAILNGYDDAALRGAGWGIIADYLAPHTTSGCGRLEARVTAVWAPDRSQAAHLARTCDIDDVVDDLAALGEAVDAVILARDDWETHLELARPLLEAGLPVFVDKPLTLEAAELATFDPYLVRGQLASWSGLRFAPELAELDAEAPMLVRGTGVGTWDRYAVHVVEPALLLAGAPVAAATALAAAHESVALHTTDGRLVQIDLLGAGATTGFHLEVATTTGRQHVQLRDPFTSFQRSLAAFVDQVRTGTPAVDPDETRGVVRALIAGRRALAEQRTVHLSEVEA